MKVSVGGACNSNCIFCRRTSGAIRSIEEIMAEIDASTAGETIVLTGGEPTLHPGLLNIIGHAHKKGLKISIETNGRMLSSEKYCSRLAGSGAAIVSVSLHGDSPEIHDMITRTPGSFDQTLRGLTNLSKHANIRKEARIHITKENQGRLCSIISLLKQHGIDVFTLSYEQATFQLAEEINNARDMARVRTECKGYKDLMKAFEISSFLRGRGISHIIDDIDIALAAEGAPFTSRKDCFNEDMAVLVKDPLGRLLHEKDCIFKQNNEAFQELMSLTGLEVSIRKTGGRDSVARRLPDTEIMIVPLEIKIRQFENDIGNMSREKLLDAKSRTVRLVQQGYLPARMLDAIERELGNRPERQEQDYGMEYKGTGIGNSVVIAPARLAASKPDGILVTHDTNPSIMPHLLKCKGMIVERSTYGAHAVQVAKELKIPCILGVYDITKRIADDDIVEMDEKEGIVRLLAKKGMYSCIAQSKDGNKAGTLAKLHGHNIPRGFSVSPGLFMLHLSNCGILTEIRSMLDEMRNGLQKRHASRLAEMKSAIMQQGFPDMNWLQAFHTAYIEGEHIARSSADIEDSKGATYAGIFRSSRGRGFLELERSIKEVWASAIDPVVFMYMTRRKIEPKLPAMGVLVQEFIRFDRSGVYISDYKDGKSLIESVAGDNKVVEGAEADRLIIEGYQGQYADVIAECREVEKKLGAKVEIEWGCKGEDVFILQARHQA